MKHNIRINGEIKEIDCEIGSGILDVNGEEIFEGDKVYWAFAQNNNPDNLYCDIFWWRGGLILSHYGSRLNGFKDKDFYKISEDDLVGLEDGALVKKT